MIGEQKDIRYYGTTARGILNGPEVTGMGFWSVNPYVGCAFGCAYCYARYAHRYVMERAVSTVGPEHGVREAAESMPPWLAFERRVFVKENAPELLRKTLRHGSDRHLRLLDGESIVIGTATDPYQPAERKFRVTRRVLEVLADHPGLSVVVLAHLSQRCNTADDARAAVAPALRRAGFRGSLHVAAQDQPLPAIELRGPGRVQLQLAL